MRSSPRTSAQQTGHLRLLAVSRSKLLFLSVESWALTDFDPTLQHEKICAAKSLTLMPTYVRVAPATAEVQIILEVAATDKIHMENGNHGLAWTTSGKYTTSKTVNLLACKQLHLNHVERTKEE